MIEHLDRLWLVGSLSFLCGGIFGAILYYIFVGSKYRSGKLAEQLDELQSEFIDYKEKVVDHFSSTAHLINKMTETYKDVHDHMASSAESLCQDDHVKYQMNDALLSSNAVLSGEDLLKRKEPRIAEVEQPKDYAPKSKPSDKGTLAEDFGLKQSQDTISN